MNSGLRLSSIPENQFGAGVNVICRKGEIQPRPSFKDFSLSFETERDRELFKKGKFQGAQEYSPGNQRYIGTVIAGHLFLIDLLSGIVLNMSKTTRVFNVSQPRCYFIQAEKYLIVQDGISAPVILDGTSAHISDVTNNEVPPGTIMQYGHGRLFVTVGTNAFLAGDIYLPYAPDSLLFFNETTYLSGGGAFSFKGSLGVIRGMDFAPSYDTSTGDGPLIVWGDNGAVSYQIQLSRSDWFDTDLSKVQLEGTGVSGADAFTVINQDLFFWSNNGLRSFAVAQREATQAYRYTNLSQEVSEYTDLNTSWLEEYISLGSFNDRLFFTVNSAKTFAEDEDGNEVDDVVFKGIVSLDFAQINGGAFSGRYSKTAAYDGVWTGLDFTQILSFPAYLEKPLWFFGKNAIGNNVLIYLGQDSTGVEMGQAIDCRLYSRGFTFKDTKTGADVMFLPKKLKEVKVWIDALEGRVPISLKIRTDNYPAFSEVFNTVRKAVITKDGFLEEGETIGIARSFSPEVLAVAQDSFGFLDNKNLASGYEVQICLDWSGYMKFAKILLTSDSVREHIAVHCTQAEENSKLDIRDQLPNDFNYKIHGVNNE